MKHSIDTKIFSIAAFDGLSLSGKSTMVQMLKERSKNTVIMRENQFDPIRTLTSYVNRLLKNSEFDSVFPLASERFPEFDEVLEVARGYSNSFIGMGKNQALLAYLFTKGRNIVFSPSLAMQKRGQISRRGIYVSTHAFTIAGWKNT